MKTEAKIKKVGDKYVIYSKDGKKLGEYSTRKAAEKRLREIEYFKHKQGGEMYWNTLAAFIKGDGPEDRV